MDTISTGRGEINRLNTEPEAVEERVSGNTSHSLRSRAYRVVSFQIRCYSIVLRGMGRPLRVTANMAERRGAHRVANFSNLLARPYLAGANALQRVATRVGNSGR